MIEMVNVLELLVQNNPPARQIDRNSLSVKFQVENAFSAQTDVLQIHILRFILPTKIILF